MRLENVLEVIDKPWLRHSTGQRFFGFKDVTLVPFEPKLIDNSLLTSAHVRTLEIFVLGVFFETFLQRKWLNNYNSRIRRVVGKELKRQNRTEAFFWMMEKTNYIPDGGHRLACRSLLVVVCNVVLIFSVL